MSEICEESRELALRNNRKKKCASQRGGDSAAEDPRRVPLPADCRGPLRELKSDRCKSDCEGNSVNQTRPLKEYKELSIRLQALPMRASLRR